MAASERFNYESLFSKNSTVVAPGSSPRPKYDFAVAQYKKNAPASRPGLFRWTSTLLQKSFLARPLASQERWDVEVDLVEGHRLERRKVCGSCLGSRLAGRDQLVVEF